MSPYVRPARAPQRRHPPSPRALASARVVNAEGDLRVAIRKLARIEGGPATPGRALASSVQLQKVNDLRENLVRLRLELAELVDAEDGGTEPCPL